MDPNCVNIIVSGQSVFLTVGIPLIAAAIAGLGGALVGGYITSKSARNAVRLEHEMELERQRKSEEIALQRFYEAIYTELDTLRQGYMSGVGAALEQLQANEALIGTWPLSPEVEEFPLYKVNLHLIGRIPDVELRTLIIRTYAKMQHMKDLIILNNLSDEQHTQWEWLYAETGNPVHKQRADGEMQSMTDYAQEIKENHFSMKADLSELLAKLEKIVNERFWGWQRKQRPATRLGQMCSHF